MKSIRFTTVLVFITMMTISAQIPNASFENWSNSAPVGWVTNNSIPFNLICISQSTDAYAGASAAKIAVASYLGIDEGPLLITSFPVSSKYTSLSGYYKFSPTQGDILSITATVSKNSQVIGSGLVDISSAASTYTSFKFNITYGINDTPDSCNILFVIGSKDNLTAAHFGTYGMLDNLSLSTATLVNNSSLPNNYSLLQNYPNPFNPATTINYSVAKLGFVTLKIYDALGREVTTLVNGEKPEGSYKIEFNAGNLSSGIYFYQLKTADFVQTKKMMFLK
jgi:hypothetical protein